jgi:urease accessory protein
MIRANFISTKGAWQAKAADSVVLDYEERHRRRVTMTGVRGTEFLLDLPEAVHIRGGDALVLEDGRLIEVVAAPEKLAEVRTTDPRLMVRLAYHLGNRHAPAEVLPKAIRIRRDHVLEDMVKSLGAKVMHIEAPFEPDGGAYEAPAEVQHQHGHHGHGHGHKHDHGHDHKHGGHDHGHDHGHAHSHAHDENCTDDHCEVHGHAHGSAHDHKHEAHGHDHKHDHAHGHKHDDSHGHKH